MRVRGLRTRRGRHRSFGLCFERHLLPLVQRKSGPATNLHWSGTSGRSCANGPCVTEHIPGFGRMRAELVHGLLSEDAPSSSAYKITASDAMRMCRPRDTAMGMVTAPNPTSSVDPQSGCVTDTSPSFCAAGEGGTVCSHGRPGTCPQGASAWSTQRQWGGLSPGLGGMNRPGRVLA